MSVGEPIDRVDGRLKVTGRATYTADQNIPGLRLWRTGNERYRQGPRSPRSTPGGRARARNARGIDS